MDPEKKVWTLFSLLNMECPKVQKVSHWLSKLLMETSLQSCAFEPSSRFHLSLLRCFIHVFENQQRLTHFLAPKQIKGTCQSKKRHSSSVVKRDPRFFVNLANIRFTASGATFWFLRSTTSLPIGSMYGIFTYIYSWFLMVNVGKYTIHGCYGL